MSYRQTQGKYFDCFLLSFRSTVKYYKNTDRSKPSLISRGVGTKQKGNHSIMFKTDATVRFGQILSALELLGMRNLMSIILRYLILTLASQATCLAPL